MVTLPTSLLITLAAVGTIAICCAVIWAIPQIWYKTKYKRFRPSYEELELNHVKQLQVVRLEHLQSDLKKEQDRSIGLAQQLQDTIDKLVSKI